MSPCEATAILIRHADITGDPATNPDLNANGLARAVELVHLLGDAGIKKIYTTKKRRSQQTAQFLADALHITIYAWELLGCFQGQRHGLIFLLRTAQDIADHIFGDFTQIKCLRRQGDAP